MNQKRKRRLHTSGTRIITTISVSLVLTLLGIVGLTAIIADRVTDTLRSNIGLVVIVNEEAPNAERIALDRQLKTMPQVRDTKYTSADEINKLMRDELGDDELADINPFQSEYEVRMKPQWTSADSLNAIALQLDKIDAVYEVKVHTEIANNVNHTVNTTVMILLVVAAALLIISFVLIFNTVNLEVYARRYVIHTMQYVGAQPWFIMRPYIVRAIVTGLIAALVASALLSALIFWSAIVYPQLAGYIDRSRACSMFGILALIGTLICALATWIAARRYLHQSFDKIH